MIKCTNCNWSGEEEDTVGPLKFCPKCGDYTTANPKPKPTESINVVKVEKPKVEQTEMEKAEGKPSIDEVNKEVTESIEIPKSRPGVLARVKDIAEDLLDDGKRNRSNRKKGGKK